MTAASKSGELNIGAVAREFLANITTRIDKKAAPVDRDHVRGLERFVVL